MKLNKRYIIRKYVMATSLKDAIKKEREIAADEAWIDDKWEMPQDINVGFKN